MGKLTISMAIFNSYFDVTRGYPPKHPLVFVCWGTSPSILFFGCSPPRGQKKVTLPLSVLIQHGRDLFIALLLEVSMWRSHIFFWDDTCNWEIPPICSAVGDVLLLAFPYFTHKIPMTLAVFHGTMMINHHRWTPQQMGQQPNSIADLAYEHGNQ